jgi:hypothetical protein
MRVLLLGLVVAGLSACSAPLDPNKPLTFANDIGPLIQQNCAKCHVEQTKGKLSLATRESALEGGKSGAVVVPGDSANSRMFQLVTEQKKGKRMPPKGDPLSKKKVAMIKYWIDQGAN